IRQQSKSSYARKEIVMVERLVDLLRANDAVLRTYPIAIDDSNSPSEDEYKAKALKVAAHAKLVPDDDLENVSARMHVERGGPLLPYGDDRHVLAGTKQGLEKVVRERAYFLWQQEGCPHGQAEEHWHRALEQHIRERAYFVWQGAGCPEGLADEHWHQSK